MTTSQGRPRHARPRATSPPPPAPAPPAWPCGAHAAVSSASRAARGPGTCRLNAHVTYSLIVMSFRCAWSQTALEQVVWQVDCPGLDLLAFNAAGAAGLGVADPPALRRRWFGRRHVVGLRHLDRLGVPGAASVVVSGGVGLSIIPRMRRTHPVLPLGHRRAPPRQAVRTPPPRPTSERG